MNNYDDIINLPHHTSSKYPRMTISARSAQFAPFSALQGYSEEIKEASRLTNEKIEIDDNLKNMLDSKLQLIQSVIKTKPEVLLTYFVPDNKKTGGKYITTTVNIKRIDLYNNMLILTDNSKIPINDIIDITGDMFNMDYDS